MASWPATGNVTTRPLPVLENIQTIIDEDTKESAIVWEPHPDSYQDEYKVRQFQTSLTIYTYFKAKQVMITTCIVDELNISYLGM